MKKLLIWDGDNSLWNGTLIEGRGVSITPERVLFCQTLRDRGVLQSVASHNLLPDVLSIIAEHGLEDCFLAPQANLQTPKSVMIKIIMNELGLVKNSDVVFTDDEMFNLAEVQKALPGINTAGPEIIAYTLNSLFSKSMYTDEDKNRVRRYRSELERRKASEEYNGEYLDFLRECAMKISMRTPTLDDMPRVVDLVQRANQLSILDGSYDDSSLRMSRESIKACWSTDKFGDNGMIGMLLISKDSLREHTYIHAFVISCRMQGKGIGSYMLGTLLNEHVGETVEVIFTETEYNKSMVQLLEFYGFKYVDNIYDAKRYSKLVDAPVSLPDWIEEV